MNRQDAHVATRYIEITELKQPEVRRLQAEMGKAIFRRFWEAMGKALRRPPRATTTMDRA